VQLRSRRVGRWNRCRRCRRRTRGCEHEGDGKDEGVAHAVIPGQKNTEYSPAASAAACA